MNYQRIYDEIIERAKSRGLNKKLLDGRYYERHHIVPRCMNGTNDKSNLVLLTGREHYLCHWLLIKIKPNNHKLFIAYNRIVYGNKKFFKRRISSKQYEILKLKFSNIQRINNIGILNPNFGIAKSEEIKLKISAGNKGKVRTELTKEKLRNRVLTKEHRLSIGLSQNGRIFSEEHKQKLRGRSPWNKGRKMSDENIRLLNESKFKPCIIDNIKYNSLTDASFILGIKYSTLYKRLNSKAFTNYCYLD